MPSDLAGLLAAADAFGLTGVTSGRRLRRLVGARVRGVRASRPATCSTRWRPATPVVDPAVLREIDRGRANLVVGAPVALGNRTYKTTAKAPGSYVLAS